MAAPVSWFDLSADHRLFIPRSDGLALFRTEFHDTGGSGGAPSMPAQLAVLLNEICHARRFGKFLHYPDMKIVRANAKQSVEGIASVENEKGDYAGDTPKKQRRHAISLCYFAKSWSEADARLFESLTVAQRTEWCSISTGELGAHHPVLPIQFMPLEKQATLHKSALDVGGWVLDSSEPVPDGARQLYFARTKTWLEYATQSLAGDDLYTHPQVNDQRTADWLAMPENRVAGFDELVARVEQMLKNPAEDHMYAFFQRHCAPVAARSSGLWPRVCSSSNAAIDNYEDAVAAMHEAMDSSSGDAPSGSNNNTI
ncbi:hypothetical protein MRB53_041863 [Persea americana]|nr:hypothetical protein MRB53_041863 [Persea americana]